MLYLLLLLSIYGCVTVNGHGRLREPPSRASMWRDGFNTPEDYNDDEAFCGGVSVLWQKNHGKCGFCGDPWHAPEPRAHELGGKFGKGVITRTYKKGQEIDVWVELTTNHGGWFEFKLCPLKNPGPGNDATQECLDQHLLELADGSGTRFHIDGNKNFKLKLKLSDCVTCDHCVLQWHWKCANNWGICPDGVGRVGCGDQEYFRGCADIAIK